MIIFKTMLDIIKFMLKVVMSGVLTVIVMLGILVFVGLLLMLL